MSLCILAHWRWKRRWRTGAEWIWILSAGLQKHAVHRVQRWKGTLPLLRYTDQFLAGHRGRSQAVLAAGHDDIEGWQPVVESLTMPCLHEELINVFINIIFVPKGRGRVARGLRRERPVS